MRYLILLLVIASFPAYSAGKPPPPAAVALQGQAQGQAQGQIQGQKQQQKQQQANVQKANATGGVVNVESGAIAQGDNELSVNTSNTQNYKRHAPAVTVMPSPTTAELYVCFGLGGSSTSGAATGAWCRLEKNFYASKRAGMLASMGLYPEAAEAYCSRKLHYRDFDDKPDCENKMQDGFKYAYPPVVKLAGPPVPVKHTHKEFTDCQTKLGRCEDVTK